MGRHILRARPTSRPCAPGHSRSAAWSTQMIRTGRTGCRLEPSPCGITCGSRTAPFAWRRTQSTSVYCKPVPSATRSSASSPTARAPTACPQSGAYPVGQEKGPYDDGEDTRGSADLHLPDLGGGERQVKRSGGTETVDCGSSGQIVGPRPDEAEPVSDQRDDQPDDLGQIRMHCTGCGGEGVTPAPTLAVFGGEGRTLVIARPCTQCGGSGRTRGFIPPI
jgi:hypothetical protein